MPRPTRFIQPFIQMIQTLIANGHAYVGTDGVVYYSVSSFPAYGKLSGNSIEQLSHGAGGRTAEHAAKKHPADFFLWKPDASHLMRWPSPWGEGYPGWHIECSAMATALLGPSIDIHTGGEDNIFPHHECEIAQSEAATGKPFSHFWMHTRHLMVDGTKMSKSKGNFYTIRDLVAKGYDPLVIRFALINTRYRESMDFSLKGLHEAASAVTTLRDLAEKLQMAVAAVDEAAGENDAGHALEAADQKMLQDFTRAMDEDLNISGALAAVFLWATPLNKQKKIPFPQARSSLKALKKIDHVLAVIFPSLRPLDVETMGQIEALLTLRGRRGRQRSGGSPMNCGINWRRYRWRSRILRTGQHGGRAWRRRSFLLERALDPSASVRHRWHTSACHFLKVPWPRTCTQTTGHASCGVFVDCIRS